MKDIERARRLIEFQLGNHLKRLEESPEEFAEDERGSYAGKIAGFSEALELLESAEEGTSVDDLGVGSQTIGEFRERAKEYRQEP